MLSLSYFFLIFFLDLQIRMLTLTSSEGQAFNLDISIAKQSLTISRLLEALCSDESNGTGDIPRIPLPNVSSKTLQKVIDWCSAIPGDKQFSELDKEELFDLIVAANYLDISDLLGLGCKAVAEMFKDKSPEDIRKTFGIADDLTPKEQQQIEKETAYFDLMHPLVKSDDSERYESSTTIFRLLDLPNEILSIVFSKLNVVDRFRARVNRRLYLLEQQLGRCHLTRLDLVIGDGNIIPAVRGKIIIALGAFSSCVVIEFAKALLKKLEETICADKVNVSKLRGAPNFDPKELILSLKSIPTRELMILDFNVNAVTNESLSDWIGDKESLYLQHTYLSAARIFHLFTDIASCNLSLRRFRIEASPRTFRKLLKMIGITLANNRWVSARADIRIFAEVSMFFGSKYFFLFGNYYCGRGNRELWIERHNEDGSLPTLPCFQEDIPISYILDCDELDVVYE